MQHLDSVDNGYQIYIVCSTIGLVVTPQEHSGNPALVTMCKFITAAAVSTPTVNMRAAGLTCPSACRGQRSYFSCSSTSQLSNKTYHASLATCNKYEAVAVLHIKTQCTVSHAYICYINAVDNSSLFLGLLGHIKADSEKRVNLLKSWEASCLSGDEKTGYKTVACRNLAVVI